MDDCAICRLQRRMDEGTDDWAVARLRSGYVHLNRVQYYRGYTFFSARTCVAELHELGHSARSLFLEEMSEVAHAVHRAFTPRKLNYEALGNSVRHLHWHIVPRHSNDPRAFAPVWENLDYLRLVWTGYEDPDPVLREDLASRLLAELRRSDVDIDAELLAHPGDT